MIMNMNYLSKKSTSILK